MSINTQSRETYAERMERIAREIRNHHGRNDGWINPNRAYSMNY